MCPPNEEQCALRFSGPESTTEITRQEWHCRVEQALGRTLNPEPDGSLPVEPLEGDSLLSDPRVNQEGGEFYVSHGP